MQWIEEIPQGQEYLIIGIDRGWEISYTRLGFGQVNRIYKNFARNAGLDELAIEGISGHSMRVLAAQDLLSSGVSMPIIMQRETWSKTDTVMRFPEHGGCQVWCPFIKILKGWICEITIQNRKLARFYGSQ
jgi:hypothetical protein